MSEQPGLFFDVDKATPTESNCLRKQQEAADACCGGGLFFKYSPKTEEIIETPEKTDENSFTPRTIWENTVYEAGGLGAYLDRLFKKPQQASEKLLTDVESWIGQSFKELLVLDEMKNTESIKENEQLLINFMVVSGELSFKFRKDKEKYYSDLFHNMTTDEKLLLRHKNKDDTGKRLDYWAEQLEKSKNHPMVLRIKSEKNNRAREPHFF